MLEEQGTIGVLPLDTRNVDASITFRVAATNHKEGPFNSPSRRYLTNPYDRQQLSGSYSSTSSILNVDTFSLANQPEGTFSGYVETGMILVGQTSGAQATVTNLRLISDISGTVQGSFFIPNPNNSLNPRFETGDKVFTLINNVDNDQNAATSIAQEGFISSGTLETTQETIISVRNARVDRVSAIQERDVSRITGTELIDSQVIASSFQRDRPQNPDPLSQSFLVDEDSGVFITKCDVFFETRDENDIPVTMQIRTMENGLPTTRVLPFSEVNLTPAEVNVSADGSVATTFDFRAPVYLEGGQEYCVTLLSNFQHSIVCLFLELEKLILLHRHLFQINHILDLCLSHKMDLHGNQVNGKILSSLYTEQTLLKRVLLNSIEPRIN